MDIQDACFRQQVERRELETLSAYAAKVLDSKGRQRPLKQCALRTDFQRDRDRIIHCKSFRRLKHKTQVFLSPEGDHYRTRLTHTLEVAQIARTIARALNLNEDLTEAIALGHDLGHTPFGHAGERILNDLTGCFKHNEQSLRVVELLEGEQGLNLTWEVRDGILNHRKSCKPATLEGMAVNYADRIAYINHDIDDAMRAGVIRAIPNECAQGLGQTHSARINAMITDIVTNSRNKPYLSMSDGVEVLTEKLRQYMFSTVYLGSAAKAEEAKAERLIGSLYSTLTGQPSFLGQGSKQRIERYGLQQTVVDFIAGMTDRYAIALFKQIYIPKGWDKY